MQEVVGEAVLQLAAEIPSAGCLGTQNLIAVRLCVTTVLKWLSTPTVGMLATKVFPGPQKLFREDVCLLERAFHEAMGRGCLVWHRCQFMSRNLCQ